MEKTLLNHLAKIIICVFLTWNVSHANNPEETAHTLYKKIICPVCKGQVLEDSQSDQAILMKQDIFQSLKEGQSEEGVLQDLIKKYGENITLKPPLKLHTIPLWLLPWALLFGSIFAILLRLRRQKSG